MVRIPPATEARAAPSGASPCICDQPPRAEPSKSSLSAESGVAAPATAAAARTNAVASEACNGLFYIRLLLDDRATRVKRARAPESRGASRRQRWARRGARAVGARTGPPARGRGPHNAARSPRAPPAAGRERRHAWDTQPRRAGRVQRAHRANSDALAARRAAERRLPDRPRAALGGLHRARGARVGRRVRIDAQALVPAEAEALRRVRGRVLGRDAQPDAPLVRRPDVRQPRARPQAPRARGLTRAVSGSCPSRSRGPAGPGPAGSAAGAPRRAGAATGAAARARRRRAGRGGRPRACRRAYGAGRARACPRA